jgi:hypothetical protein
MGFSWLNEIWGASDQTRTRSGLEFGEVARTYDPVRPRYPSELVDDALTWPPTYGLDVLVPHSDRGVQCLSIRCTQRNSDAGARPASAGALESALPSHETPNPARERTGADGMPPPAGAGASPARRL